MYNLLIADDEQLERDAIEYLIQQRKLPFKVYKAKNGKEALYLFNNTKFDFIILDIKMPLINGIEVGKTIREKNKTIPIVYLTAWSSFDFAKSAISIRALDYLVKPINKKELYRVLENFIEKKALDKKNKSEEIKTVINQFSRSFFASLKHGLIDDDNLKQYFNIENTQYFEGVALVVSETNINELKNFFEQDVFFSNKFYYFPSKDRSTIIVILKNKSNFFKKLELFANNLYLKNKEQRIAIGSVFTRLKELPRSIREASIAFSIANINNEIIHEFNVIDENILNTNSANYVSEIESAIFNCDIKNARNLAHRLYDSISQLDQINLLENYYQSALILHHTLTNKILFFRIQKPNKTIHEIEIFMFNMIDNAIIAIESDKKDKYERIFHEIKNEIDINYNKQLTMEYYSTLLNMNIKYFSKLFKNYNKVSFIDYLTNIRMQKAKQLLKEGRGVRESAKAVGYLDSAYFSKVFSQKYNITPSQYKQSYEKK